MLKKTLYILDDPSRDKHVHDYVLEGLKNRGYFPIILYFWHSPKLVSRYEDKGFLTAFLSSTTKSGRGFSFRNLLRLIFLIRAMNIKVVHVQRHRLMIYAAIASQITGVRVIYTVRLTSVLRNRKRKIAFRLAVRNLSRIICVSRDVAKSLEEATKMSNLPLEIIHNGIDINQYNLSTIDKYEARQKFGLPEKSFIFGIIARLRKAKDHPTLIKAFSKFLRLQKPDAHLVIVGDGPLESELKFLASDLDAAGRILFLGRIKPTEVPVMLKAFDVFVHPSIREGLPMAVLEAMSAGLPVISNECPPILEILGADGKYGIVCPSKDEDALAEALEKVYNMSEEELIKLGQIGRQRIIENFSKESMVEKTLRVYDEVVASESKTAHL